MSHIAPDNSAIVVASAINRKHDWCLNRLHKIRLVGLETSISSVGDIVMGFCLTPLRKLRVIIRVRDLCARNTDLQRRELRNGHGITTLLSCHVSNRRIIRGIKTNLLDDPVAILPQILDNILRIQPDTVVD